MEHEEILHWLQETNPDRLRNLWRRADRTRHECVGDEVHLRGLVELSNYCVRQCGYCGLRAGNAKLQRYRLSDDEILACGRQAVEFGYGAVVLQAGEDPALDCRWIERLVRHIKVETPLAVTLSLGERDEEELAVSCAAGADRYLLRFETSNRALFDRIHPPRSIPHTPCAEAQRIPHTPCAEAQRIPHTPCAEAQRIPHTPCAEIGTRRVPDTMRLTILATLRHLGYEVGSGVMIGIPGQSYDDLADDIEWFGRLDLDMIGVGPYLRHPETPLADRAAWPAAPEGRQVPADELTTYKVIALARLACPRSNIPATTALATLNRREGREWGLMRGANVVMPNLTPAKYRALYEIYPDKACVAETGQSCHRCLVGRIKAIGRRLGRGRGDSNNFAARSSRQEDQVTGVF